MHAGAVRTDRWGAAEVVGDVEMATQEQIQGGTSQVYLDGNVGDGWRAAHWYAEVDDAADNGRNGRAACGKVYPSGALSYEHDTGVFDGKTSMELWVKTDDGVPDIQINVAGDETNCRPVKLQDMNKSGEDSGWSRYDLYLGLFDATDDRVVAFAEQFRGCGGMSTSQLKRIDIKNDRPFEQQICVDDVKLRG